MTNPDMDALPEYREFMEQIGEITASVAQVITSSASREGRMVESADFLAGAMALNAASIKLANLGGDAMLLEHARLMRGVADEIEAAAGTSNV